MQFMLEETSDVKLISVTQPLVKNIATPEELIVFCARVSNPSNQYNTKTSNKLIKYCIENGHWSPFEMANMTVEIITSRAIATQILRHKSFSFQEFSQRYSVSTSIQGLSWRSQGDTNRQVGKEPIDLSDDLEEKVQLSQKFCLQTYQDLIDSGVAKECARMVLPLNTTTTLYMSGSVRSWIHYLQIRTEENTQEEHRIIANKIKDIFIVEFPNISEALGFQCVECKNIDMQDIENYILSDKKVDKCLCIVDSDSFKISEIKRLNLSEYHFEIVSTDENTDIQTTKIIGVIRTDSDSPEVIWCDIQGYTTKTEIE